MKDTIHTAFDNYLAARWQRAGAFLQQMMIMDQVRDQHEMKVVIADTLRDIGGYTESSRVYLFDKSSEADDTYLNIAEWCADGLPSHAERFRVLHHDDMPYWSQKLENGEMLFIHDLEQERERMPVEYAAMKGTDIRSEIVAPIFYHRRLAGFIGVDNPRDEISELFIHQLSFIGSHLYSARENLRMVAQLEHELQAKEKEKQVLTVLCQDSTSVFRVNLLRNEAESVKVTLNTNVAQILSGKENSIFCYTYEMQRFYNHYVLPESAPDFMDVFSPHYLMNALSQRDTFRYRFQMKPNGLGQQHFEVRATKIAQTENNFQILLDFHHIDEIVREERKQREELENALAATRASNEVISAIGKIYFSIYRIDLKKFYFEEISYENTEARVIGTRGAASVNIRAHDRDRVAENFREHVEEFFDLRTLKERLQNEESIAVEYPIVDGNWHMARFIVQKRDVDGSVEQVLCVVRQISEEKRREEQWMLAANEANAANKAKSEFLSRMSHDIRTPMNVIMGFVNIAQEHINNPEKLADCLQKIRYSGEELQQLIDDVLDISRIESGEFRIEAVPVDLCGLIQSHCRSIENTFADRGLHFRCNIHDIRHNILLTDQLRLRQIYMNLLSNAAKYTPEGGRVDFEVYEERLPTDHLVRLVSVVRDTGIGIAPEYMKDMFAQFSRAVDTRVNKVRGSGLGLSIVKKIVDLMGGTIDVQSKIGEGSTFRVTLDLPFSADSAMPKKKAEEAVVLPARPLTLLIAEDNELSYEIVAEQLSMYGIHCVRAENGAECVQKFQQAKAGTFDAILMDMQMPVMSGPEAAAVIRAMEHPQAKTVPILALTANAYREDIEKCLNAGMNAHLSKPVDINHILCAVVALLPK